MPTRESAGHAETDLHQAHPLACRLVPMAVQPVMTLPARPLRNSLPRLWTAHTSCIEKSYSDPMGAGGCVTLFFLRVTAVCANSLPVITAPVFGVMFFLAV